MYDDDTTTHTNPATIGLLVGLGVFALGGGVLGLILLSGDDKSKPAPSAVRVNAQPVTTSRIDPEAVERELGPLVKRPGVVVPVQGAVLPANPTPAPRKTDSLARHAFWTVPVTEQQIEGLVNLITARNANELIFVDSQLHTYRHHSPVFDGLDIQHATRLAREDEGIGPRYLTIVLDPVRFRSRLTTEQARVLLKEELDKAEFRHGSR